MKVLKAERRLGYAIKTARHRVGIGQQELATRLGVQANYVSLLENDRRDPSWNLLCRLADALEIQLAVLMLLAESSTDSIAMLALAIAGPPSCPPTTT